MSAPFASQSWVEALATALEGSARVRTEAGSWVFGPMLLVIDADGEHGFEQAAIVLDLHDGGVRAVELGSVDSARVTPFVLGGSFAHWKAALGGSTDVVGAVLDSKLRFDGDLPTLMRHRPLLAAIAEAAQGIDTEWQDEQAQEPAATA